MQVDPNVVWTILALFGVGGGLVGVIQTLKRILKLEGVGAIVLTAVCSVIATAVVLLVSHVFSILGLIVYSFIVFGEASGLYHVFSRTKTSY